VSFSGAHAGTPLFQKSVGLLGVMLLKIHHTT
jgi:hypothetical protein